MSSLIEPTIALESQNKNDMQGPSGRIVNYVYVYYSMCTVHVLLLSTLYSANKHPTVFLNTVDRSAGVVFISASGFL